MPDPTRSRHISLRIPCAKLFQQNVLAQHKPRRQKSTVDVHRGGVHGDTGDSGRGTLVLPRGDHCDRVSGLQKTHPLFLTKVSIPLAAHKLEAISSMTLQIPSMDAHLCQLPSRLISSMA